MAAARLQERADGRISALVSINRPSSTVEGLRGSVDAIHSANDQASGESPQPSAAASPATLRNSDSNSAGP